MANAPDGAESSVGSLALLHTFFELARRPAIELHPKRQAHLGQDLLDFLQRLATKVLGLEHLGLCLLNQLTNVGDVGVRQTVRAANGKLEFIYRAQEVLVELLATLLVTRRLRLSTFIEVDEDGNLNRQFIHVQSSIGASEAEEIGVEHLLRDIKDAS